MDAKVAPLIRCKSMYQLVQHLKALSNGHNFAGYHRFRCRKTLKALKNNHATKEGIVVWLRGQPLEKYPVALSSLKWASTSIAGVWLPTIRNIELKAEDDQTTKLLAATRQELVWQQRLLSEIC